MRVDQVIKRPRVLTEKAASLQSTLSTFVFEVADEATKGDVKAAVESFYNVKVVDVRTLIVRGKDRRIGRRKFKRPNWKKAFVRLGEGQVLDVFAE